MDCVCVFSCARDARLMPVQAAGVRRVLPEAGLVYVVPEGEVGAFPAGALRRYGAQVVPSCWERGRSLCGAEAVQGVLHTLAACGRACGGAVVKLDADSVLLRADWLEGLRSGGCGYVGFECWQGMLPTGACYALSAEGAVRCAEAVTPWRWLGADGSPWLPEDRAVFLTALRVLGDAGAQVMPWDAPGEVSPRVVGFDPVFYGGTRPSRRAVAVHCGEKPQLALYERMGLDRTQQVLRAMRCVMD